jgi:hypothetical protein
MSEIKPYVAKETHPMYPAHTTPGEVNNVFREADEQYEQIKKTLSGDEISHSTHSEVERLLEKIGRELIRRLYQSHLLLRSQVTPEEVVCGDDGVERTHQRKGTSRPLTTLFGTVEVKRAGYTARGSSSRFPLDGELNLPLDKYSFEVRRRVATFSSQDSFDQAEETLAETTGAKVRKRQIEELTVRAAGDFESFYAATALDLDPEETGDLLVLTFDHKGIVMRHDDLRPATKKAAESRSRKVGERLKTGEKRNRKRMACVASVYTVEPWVRTPESIAQRLGPVREVKKDEQRPRPESKRVWASVERNSKQVIREAFEEAEKRDPERKKRWVVLVDGEEKLRCLVRATARKRGRAVTVVMDVIHMIEYLWKASYVFHPQGSAEAQEWVDERLLAVLQGKAGRVAGGMRRSATLRAISKSKRQAVDKCASYLLKNKQAFRYDKFLADGLPIATGVIEGACRHLVRDRMDITGARWRLERAEAVLKLRALRSSGDFEDYWCYHEEQEARRNHASRYATGAVPKLVYPPHLRVIK